MSVETFFVRWAFLTLNGQKKPNPGSTRLEVGVGDSAKVAPWCGWKPAGSSREAFGKRLSSLATLAFGFWQGAAVLFGCKEPCCPLLEVHAASTEFRVSSEVLFEMRFRDKHDARAEAAVSTRK